MSSHSQEKVTLYPKQSDFDKALGMFAEGLLLFHDHRSEGMMLLTDAVNKAPHNSRLIDTWLEKAEARILAETNFADKISDFVKLQRYTLQSFYPIAKKNPTASYLHLVLVETALELDKQNLAETLAQNLSSDEENLHKVLIELKLKKYSSEREFHQALNNSRLLSTYKKYHSLQLYIQRSYLDMEKEDVSKDLLENSIYLIQSIPQLPGPTNKKLCELITSGIIAGSDIGTGAKNQLADSFYGTPSLRQWASLAAILMKLELYSEASVILTHKVLKSAEKKWRAYLSLSNCAYYTGDKEARLAYLEKAVALRPQTSSLKRSLAAAYLNLRKYKQAEKILDSLRPLKSVQMLKVEFYLNTALKRYQTAFKQAERLYNWPDPAEKISVVSPSFAAYTTEVYKKAGKRRLLLKRLDEAMRYNPQNLSLKNTVAYFMAENNIELDKAATLIQTVIETEDDKAAYLDTYAWVMYHQGKFKLAWAAIKKAVELDESKSAVILLHAGDICLANNGWFAESQAKKLWLKALKLQPQLKREVEQRLNNQ